MGGSLQGIRMKDAAREIAAFTISGDNIDRLASDYRQGKALVNPVLLRDSLNYLRDTLSELREKRRRDEIPKTKPTRQRRR